jgi:hypothetical protein
MILSLTDSCRDPVSTPSNAPDDRAVLPADRTIVTLPDPPRLGQTPPMPRASTPRDASARTTGSRRRASTTAAAPPAAPTAEATAQPFEPTTAISALIGAATAREPEPYLPPTIAVPGRTGTMVIGEEDPNIFACPVCMRPLATGVRRCPGCRTRLVMGVPMRRASAFIATGLLVGVVVAGGILAGVAAIGGGGRPGPSQPAVGVLPSASTSPTAAPTASAAPTPVLPDVPPTARAALGQVGTLHVRLLEGAVDLQAHLAAPVLDTSAVARTLRSMNSNAAFGLDIAKRLATWDMATPLATDLTVLYEDVRATAREGLAASVRNSAAYEAAATGMLALVADLESLDADARALALTADVDLPSLDLDALGARPPATSETPAAP